MATHLECVSFTLIVDDIVLPHGETVMEVLGGGGSQTLFGYQLVTGQTAAVGLSAGVGPDLPQRCKDWLESIGADTSGLVLHQRPTPRAWQVFEEWGRRTQIWRGRDDPCDETYAMLNPRWEALPPHFRRATNYHLCVHPLHPPLRLLGQLRAAAHENGGVLSVETYTAAEEPARPEQVAALLAACDIFSPNEAEAESIVGPGSPEALARRLLALSPPGGADVVVIRCGPAGVLAARRGRGSRGAASAEVSQRGTSDAYTGADEEVEAYQVPAVADTCVVDVTGCGNAFCGGFLAALYRGAGRAAHGAGSNTDCHAASGDSGDNSGGCGPAGHGPPAWLGAADLASGAAWGCVAASFMAEERGVPTRPVTQLQDKANQRLKALLPRVQPVRLARVSATTKVTARLRVWPAASGARRAPEKQVAVPQGMRL